MMNRGYIYFPGTQGKRSRQKSVTAVAKYKRITGVSLVRFMRFCRCFTAQPLVGQAQVFCHGAQVSRENMEGQYEA
jgi:hypothetical protein